MSQYKILVVEDESIVAMDLKQRLMAMDYEVTETVSNGAAAIEQVAACLPDLVLMDIQIKGDIDGIETAARIQERFDIPIVFLTANSDVATVTRAKEAGPLAYLLKPFEDRDLLTTIEIALHRHQLEQRLKASERWLQTVLKSIGDGVFATDKEGRVIFMNPMAEDLTGWTSEESELMDSDEILNLVSEESGQTVENPVRKCLRDGSLVGVTNHAELINRSGRRIPIEDNAAPIHDDQGNLVGCVMVFRDVTRSRDAEKKIIAYRDQLKKLLTIRTGELDETMANLSQETTKRHQAEEKALDLSLFPEENPCPVMRISGDGILKYANRASALILDFWKCKMNQLLPEKWMNLISEALASGTHSNLEVEVEGRTYSLVVAPIVDSGYVNLYGRDITIQRQSEEKERDLRDQLERAERMKALGLLAGGVAHDLNNMLGPLVGYPELILKKLQDDSPIRKQVERIGSAAKDAASVIQDLLALARRGRYDMVPISPNQMIADYLESPGFESIAHKHPGISLVTDIDPDLPHIKGSAPHLSKVIMNLIVNAIDAISDTGTVTIETRSEQIDKLISGHSSINPGEYVIITVRDTGCGISSKDMDKIFEPYYSKKDKQGHSGSGLGLSVVYGIVKDHGGYYDVISEVGKGTEFILYFPHTLEAPEDSGSSEEVPGGYETILVVDDNSGQRELLRDTLSSLGYEVVLAKNGTDAVSIMKNRSVDLIILDMIMDEGFDGLDTYREVMKYQPLQKAVIVSGFSASTRVDEALGLGVGAYIRKPFDMATIADAVREELDKAAVVSSY